MLDPSVLPTVFTLIRAWRIVIIFGKKILSEQKYRIAEFSNIDCVKIMVQILLKFLIFFRPKFASQFLLILFLSIVCRGENCIA